VSWVLDADIRGFFYNLSHEWTMKFIEHRVGRSKDTSPDPEMAEGGGIGRRPVVGDETGYTAGSGFTADRRRVSTLPLRSKG
jgi:hypothetical protein